MDEQFDKKLTNHIREVFDNYEHAGAEHGWAQLKQKLPAPEAKKVAWLWWSSAAAIVLLLGIGLSYNNQDSGVNNMAVTSPVKTQQPAMVKDSPVIKSTVDTTLLIGKEPVIANNSSSPAFNNPATLSLSIKRGPAASGTGNTNQPSNSKSNTWIGHPQPWQLPANAVVKTNPVIANTGKPVIDSQKVSNNITNQPHIADNHAAVNEATQLAAVNTPQSANTSSAKKTMSDMFNEDKREQLAKRNDGIKQDNQDNKKVNFSIYAATYFNYAEGSTNQINAGAGITSDFRLSKNLKLSTGIALAQNSLSYNTSAPQSSNQAFAAAPPLKQATLFGAAALTPVFENYNANLVGLDIPINIKYEFNPQKSDAYISAGLSSGTFIDENYTYRYSYSNGTSTIGNTQTERTAHNSFNSFYFAKTLNLSFGLGYPIGNNRLIVEPFVKYPLGGLGAQDIRFGAGGVNLKFSFKPHKK